MYHELALRVVFVRLLTLQQSHVVFCSERSSAEKSTQLPPPEPCGTPALQSVAYMGIAVKRTNAREHRVMALDLRIVAPSFLTSGRKCRSSLATVKIYLVTSK